MNCVDTLTGANYGIWVSAGSCFKNGTAFESIWVPDYSSAYPYEADQFGSTLVRPADGNSDVTCKRIVGTPVVVFGQTVVGSCVCDPGYGGYLCDYQFPAPPPDAPGPVPVLPSQMLVLYPLADVVNATATTTTTTTSARVILAIAETRFDMTARRAVTGAAWRSTNLWPWLELACDNSFLVARSQATDATCFMYPLPPANDTVAVTVVAGAAADITTTTAAPLLGWISGRVLDPPRDTSNNVLPVAGYQEVVRALGLPIVGNCEYVGDALECTFVSTTGEYFVVAVNP